MNKAIRNFVNGIAFGITETVPGVSGGTIAVILGFFDELIHSINNFRKDVKKSLKFLIPLALGLVSGLLVLGSIIHYLLINFSLPTMAFFIGLIVGIIPVIYSNIKGPGKMPDLKGVLLILAPVVVLVVTASIKNIFVTESVADISQVTFPQMVFIFFSGIIAAAALVIPGVSGSFILLLTGVYPLFIESIASVRLIIFDLSNTSLLMDTLKVLAPLAVGIIIGGLLMVRFVESLLKNHYRIIYSVILGLLVGSVYVLLREPLTFQSGISTVSILIGVATFLAGLVFSFFSGKKHF